MSVVTVFWRVSVAVNNFFLVLYFTDINLLPEMFLYIDNHGRPGHHAPDQARRAYRWVCCCSHVERYLLLVQSHVPPGPVMLLVQVKSSEHCLLTLNHVLACYVWYWTLLYPTLSTKELSPLRILTAMSPIRGVWHLFSRNFLVRGKMTVISW